ncbi:MAG: hypothetical protein ACTSQY_11320 [Candidatus Odinarchaeia archaeon]
MLVRYSGLSILKTYTKALINYRSYGILESNITDIPGVTNLKIDLSTDENFLDVSWDYFTTCESFKIYLSDNPYNMLDYQYLTEVLYEANKINYIETISKTDKYVIVIPFAANELGVANFIKYVPPVTPKIEAEVIAETVDTMKDVKNKTFCDHLIKDEKIDLIFDSNIQKYYCVTKYKHTKNKKMIKIKEYYSDKEIEDIDIDQSNRIIINQLDVNLNSLPKPIFLIEYVVELNSCPKCYGTKELYDIYPTPKADIATLTNLAKVQNYIIKALKTELNSNILHLDYGTTLSELIGQKLTPISIALVKKIIYETIDKLIEYQNDEIDIPAEQRIYSIGELIITNPDLRTIEINIQIILQNAEILNIDLKQEL